MSPAPSKSLLTRVRASVRLSAFVLLVFVLKIGVAAACVDHDFLDLGLGSGSGHAAIMNGDVAGSDQSGEAPVEVAGDCDHSNHHASAIVPVAHQLIFRFASRLPASVSGLPPSALPGSQLRPPIA